MSEQEVKVSTEINPNMSDEYKESVARKWIDNTFLNPKDISVVLIEHSEDQFYTVYMESATDDSVLSLQATISIETVQ